MEITKAFRGLEHGMHRENVRSVVTQPGEEKVSRDPFSIFRGLRGITEKMELESSQRGRRRG